MRKLLTLLFSVLIFSSCKSQIEKENNRLIGGPCQDCESVLDYKILNIKPTSTLRINGFDSIKPKIKITGTVFKPDGKTPAKDVVLYVYQTNRKGLYEPSKNPIGWEKRHGKFRGWMKTDSDGKFQFHTFRPGPYPDGREPEHIHLYVKESSKNPYYLDSYLFDDAPLLTSNKRDSIDKRGGSGIIELIKKDGILTANRDITLGLNIPDYK